MFSEQSAKAGITYPKGFLAAGVKAGIKRSGNPDVAVIYSEKEAAVAGTFTKNAVAAAPVHVSKAVVATHTAHAIVANAGCANACTGAQGEEDAVCMQEIAADALGCGAQDVIVASTGIIGQPLPMDKVESGIHAAGQGAFSGWQCGCGERHHYGQIRIPKPGRQRLRSAEKRSGLASLQKVPA